MTTAVIRRSGRVIEAAYAPGEGGRPLRKPAKGQFMRHVALQWLLFPAAIVGALACGGCRSQSPPSASPEESLVLCCDSRSRAMMCSPFDKAESVLRRLVSELGGSVSTEHGTNRADISYGWPLDSEVISLRWEPQDHSGDMVLEAYSNNYSQEPARVLLGYLEFAMRQAGVFLDSGPETECVAPLVSPGPQELTSAAEDVLRAHGWADVRLAAVQEGLTIIGQRPRSREDIMVRFMAVGSHLACEVTQRGPVVGAREEHQVLSGILERLSGGKEITYERFGCD